MLCLMCRPRDLVSRPDNMDKLYYTHVLCISAFIYGSDIKPVTCFLVRTLPREVPDVAKEQIYVNAKSR